MHIQADCAGFHSFTLSSKFEISMPKEVRETLNLQPGQRLAFPCLGKSLKLVPQLP